MFTTHFEDMHLFIHSICVWHRRSCTEKRSPTLSTGSNWPRREGNLPDLFTTFSFFLQGGAGDQPAGERGAAHQPDHGGGGEGGGGEGEGQPEGDG